MTLTMSTKPLQQRYRILRLAVERQSEGFTRADAAIEVGCYELASRIGELEAEGVVFKKQNERVTTRYGGRTTVTRYTLVDAPKELRRTAFGYAPRKVSAAEATV